MPSVTLIDVLPDPPDVVMSAPDKVGPVTVKPKVSSPPRACLSIMMVPGVVKVSTKVHVIAPPGGTLKFVGENGGLNRVPSVHEADVRLQPRGRIVSATV